MRAIFEALGASVDWDQAYRETVTATKNGTTVKLRIGSETAYRNDQPITLEVPGIMDENWRTMVPLRFVSEALGANVDWNETTLQ